MECRNATRFVVMLDERLLIYFYSFFTLIQDITIASSYPGDEFAYAWIIVTLALAIFMSKVMFVF